MDYFGRGGTQRWLKTSVANIRKRNVVTLYKTDIVIFDEKTAILNSGGFLTRTTMRRMNQVSNEFGLDFRVYNDNGWKVDHLRSIVNFRDGMILRRA